MKPCGSYACYLAGCRCVDCTTAQREYQRNRRKGNDALRLKDNEKHRALRRRAPRRVRDREFREMHGIGLDARDRMLEAQGGKCAICKTAAFGVRGPVLDHDHVSNHLRNVLCLTCNIGLGAFKDDPALLRVAATYLEEHAARIAQLPPCPVSPRGRTRPPARRTVAVDEHW